MATRKTRLVDSDTALVGLYLSSATAGKLGAVTRKGRKRQSSRQQKARNTGGSLPSPRFV